MENQNHFSNADSYIISQYKQRFKSLLRGHFRTPLEVKKRAHTDIFNYQAISKPLKFYPYVPIKENNLYGNGYLIGKKFRNLDLRVTTIEHGLYIGSIVPERHLIGIYDNIITYSDYRKKFIESKTDKNIITIGPYIKYAHSLYSDNKLTATRNKLGKTLLVFPSHSIDSIYAEYDIEKFIRYIKQFAIEHDFKTVLVCLYWKDIALKMDTKYLNADLSIVSAGHSYDINFLNRLKTFFLLADATLTNAVGTHVGYSLTLGVPIKIWSEDKINYYPNIGKELEAEKELNMRKTVDLNSYLSDVDEIEKTFSEFNGTITNEQVECVNYYWGN